MEKCLHWSNKSAMIIYDERCQKRILLTPFFAFKSIKEWRKIR